MLRNRVAVALACLGVLAGCAAPVVYRHPSTREIVDCTAEAGRDLAAQPPRYGGGGRLFPAETGTGVPRRDEVSAEMLSFDLERQCAEELTRAGWACVSGCR